MPIEVIIHSDGACRGNPGPGGWGAVLEYGAQRKELYGGEAHTTNNRMELMAVIQALQLLKRRCRVKVVSDSKYVLQGMTTWIHDWKRRGWRTAAKKPVLNSDLWQLLDQLVAQHDVTWEWVKGHSGHPLNDLADALANRGIDELPVC
ncbi:MAG TPA: ribonuclease HI [Hyphomicrobiales bacterium]|nr:ribonuclease HI [Hyphomicrobiales bacterium]